MQPPPRRARRGRALRRAPTRRPTGARRPRRHRRRADAVVIAPSNPHRVDRPGPRRARRPRTRSSRRRATPSRVSPIVGGAALKGPADRLLRELGHEASVVGVAAALRRPRRRPWSSTRPTPTLAAAVEAEGMRLRRGPDDHARPGRGRRPGPDGPRRAGGRAVTRLEIFGVDGHRRDPRRATTSPGIIAAPPWPARDRARRRRRRRRHPEGRVQGRGPARRHRPRRPARPQAARRGTSRCGSCAAAATSSSARPGTASSAPTPASTSPTSSGARPRCSPTTATARPAASATACGPGPASRSAVIVSDTFGRPWRRGVTDVAIGCAGIGAVVDLRGHDRRARPRAAGHRGGRRRRARRARPSSSWARPTASPSPSSAGSTRRGSGAAASRDEIVRPPEDDLFR